MSNDINRQFEQLSGRRAPESLFRKTSSYRVLLTLLFTAAVFLTAMVGVLDYIWFPVGPKQWAICQQPTGTIAVSQGPKVNNFCFGGSREVTYYEQRRKLPLGFQVQLSDGQEVAFEGWLVYDLPTEPDKVLEIWSNSVSQMDFEKGILVPSVLHEVSEAFAVIPGNALLPPLMRELVSKAIGRLIEDEIGERWGIEIRTLAFTGYVRITLPNPRPQPRRIKRPKEIPL